MEKNKHKLILLLIGTFLLGSLYGQQRDSIVVKKFPIKNGYVFYKDSQFMNYGDPSDGIRIFSNSVFSDSVFSLFDGNVYSLYKEENNSFVCTIKSELYSITYFYLTNCNFSEGTSIKRGECIGRISDDGGVKCINIIIGDKDGILNFKEHVELLK